MIKTTLGRAKDRVGKDQYMGAQRDLLEQLYDDHYKGRWRVYHVNFVRGIFFGLGSVIGATIIVSIVLWALSNFVQLPDSLLKQLENQQQSKTQ